MNARDISLALAIRQWPYSNNICCENIYWPWEMDLAVLRESGYLYEVEIKISASDFRQEFKTKADKHDMLVNGEIDSEWISRDGEFQKVIHGRKPHMSSSFYFAMPLDLALKLKSEIPEYAGLIGVHESMHFPRVIKKAPKLKNARKLTDDERMRFMRYAYLRYWSRREDKLFQYSTRAGSGD